MKNRGLFQYPRLNFIVLLSGIILSALLSFDIVQEKSALYDSTTTRPELLFLMLFGVTILPFIVCSLFISHLRMQKDTVKLISSSSTKLIAFGFTAGYVLGAGLMQAALDHNPQGEYTDHPFDLFFVFYSCFSIIAVPFFVLALLCEYYIYTTANHTRLKPVIASLVAITILSLAGIFIFLPKESHTIGVVYSCLSMSVGMIIIPWMFALYPVKPIK